MANMSYCRFQNTALDLKDCLNNLHDVLSEDEHEARRRLIKIAKRIVEESDEFHTDPYEQTDDYDIDDETDPMGDGPEPKKWP